jgi:hypothetical protein
MVARRAGENLTLYAQHLELFINAGSFYDSEYVNENGFGLFYNNNSLRDIFLDKKLMSKKAVETCIRNMVLCIPSG